MEEQLQEQATKLTKLEPKVAPRKEKTLAEQLQEQLELMKAKTAKAEEDKKLGIPSLPSALKKQATIEVAAEDNQAWNLTRQLKSRMQAMQGRSKKPQDAKKKAKFKQL